MTNAAIKQATQSIVVEEVFPYAPERLWKVLTDSTLIGNWMPMEPVGFAPVVGTEFTYHTTPAGAWDGTIHCRVLEVIANECLAYSWRGGDEGNVGYGAPLDTVVTYTLERVAGGTRLRLIHSGFVLPRNELAHVNMGRGWTKIVSQVGELAGEQAD
jgi:uncharacterized protein YndB with AHSA1/START domain